jgi:heme/copper-type cytochrome/quinol oxidase subunit 1
MQKFKIAFEVLSILWVASYLIYFVTILQGNTCVELFFSTQLQSNILSVWLVLCGFSFCFTFIALDGLLRVVKRLEKSGQNLKINFCSMSIHCAAYALQLSASFFASLFSIWNSGDPVVTLVSLNAFDFCV